MIEISVFVTSLAREAVEKICQLFHECSSLLQLEVRHSTENLLKLVNMVLFGCLEYTLGSTFLCFHVDKDVFLKHCVCGQRRKNSVFKNTHVHVDWASGKSVSGFFYYSLIIIFRKGLGLNHESFHMIKLIHAFLIHEFLVLWIKLKDLSFCAKE